MTDAKLLNGVSMPAMAIGYHRMTATAQCPHSDLHITLNHRCREDTNLHYFDISAFCKICGRIMDFREEPFSVPPDGIPTVALAVPFIAAGERLRGDPAAHNRVS
jgi:hypothetical protein